MKHILFVLLLAIGTPAAFAQTTSAAKKATPASGKTVEQRAQEITAGMAKHLGLTPDQVKKVGAINLASMQHAEAAKNQYKDNPKMLMQQMDMIGQTRLSQIKEVLSPVQFAQYQQRREEKMGVPKEAQSNPSSAQPGGYQDQN
ncbi:hypothetical protein FVR03_02910 [Pontibacter qinzhouensis]|uniref:DUF4168 domain-containing protein n=1 Tax=Pontibacter qinzhouensis TaxID=2603253 RepID=A0A5C8KCG1_9BACT|nr:hypothetical protein [Pontibacter qinzhouensis]TXK51901.1 hypothetical protein FVR03_02910 [Pontibacter qinzhouensis]